MVDLTDRVVLVTGGNGGIGLGLAEGCLRAGASVAIWGTNQAKLDAAAATLEAQREERTTVLAQQVDVSSEDEVRDGFAEAVAALGRVDAAFANAGVSGGGPFVDQTLTEWRRVLAVNLDGAFLTLREAARHMIERWVETEMTEPGRTNVTFLENTTKRTPIRRWGLPSDFGDVGAFLADPDQPFHTGDEIVLDGGYSRF